MSGPLVTIGVPVYRGQDLLPVALECVRTQTYINLDVLISVDGPDDPSVEAARPFLSDPRFRMVVQPKRLGWAGNHGFTIRERRGAFYVYQQHDDHVSPNYVEALVAAAERWPQASVCYTTMQIQGIKKRVVRSKPTLGTPIERAVTQMNRLDSVMLRGLMRGSALDATGGLIPDEVDDYCSEQRLLVELALAGEFRLVPGPTYFKNIHGKNLHLKRYDWSDEKKRKAWTMLAASMIGIIVPRGSSLDERWRLLHQVIDRFIVTPGVLSRLRNQTRRLYRSDRASRRFPKLIDWVRTNEFLNAWLFEHSRFMFYQAGNDPAARRELLHAILDQARQRGLFDPAAHLQTDWAGLRERAARQLGVAASQHP